MLKLAYAHTVLTVCLRRKLQDAAEGAPGKRIQESLQQVKDAIKLFTSRRLQVISNRRALQLQSVERESLLKAEQP